MTLEAQAGGGLVDLAARCEAATGPDRGLFLEIAVALDMRPDWLTRSTGELWVDTSGHNPVLRWADISIGKSSGNPSVDDPPNFLTSIDAALTLVPEGYHFDVLTTMYGGWIAELGTREGPRGLGKASSGPLAICAAALRARAAIQLAEGR